MSGILDKQYADAREKKSYLSFRYKERALVAASTIQKYFGERPIQLVDFGASEGRTLLEMRRLLGEKGTYMGIEYDQGLIRSAPPLPPGVSLLQGDITELSMVPDQSADVITALAVLEHLGNPLGALKEAERILKPGGLFIATAPNPFWDRLADLFGMSAFGGEHHEIELNERIFRDLLQKTDLRYEAFFPFMWAVLGFLPYLKVPISASFAWKTDQVLQRLRFLNWLFVNQCFVATKKR